MIELSLELVKQSTTYITSGEVLQRMFDYDFREAPRAISALSARGLRVLAPDSTAIARVARTSVCLVPLP